MTKSAQSMKKSKGGSSVAPFYRSLVQVLLAMRRNHHRDRDTKNSNVHSNSNVADPQGSYGVINLRPLKSAIAQVGMVVIGWRWCGDRGWKNKAVSFCSLL